MSVIVKVVFKNGATTEIKSSKTKDELDTMIHLGMQKKQVLFLEEDINHAEQAQQQFPIKATRMMINFDDVIMAATIELNESPITMVPRIIKPS